MKKRDNNTKKNMKSLVLQLLLIIVGFSAHYVLWGVASYGSVFSFLFTFIGVFLIMLIGGIIKIFLEYPVAKKDK